MTREGHFLRCGYKSTFVPLHNRYELGRKLDPREATMPPGEAAAAVQRAREAAAEQSGFSIPTVPPPPGYCQVCGKNEDLVVSGRYMCFNDGCALLARRKRIGS